MKKKDVIIMASNKDPFFEFDYSRYDFPLELDTLKSLVQDLANLPTGVSNIFLWIMMTLKVVGLFALCWIFNQRKEVEYLKAKQNYEKEIHRRHEDDVNDPTSL